MSSGKKQKLVIGVVISNKMQKTINVRVTKKRRHPDYGKFIDFSFNCLTHVDQEAFIPEGTKVLIKSSNKYSKNKSYEFVKIVTE